ncbi:MAG TPA: X2-like carbohydrate binding domain-containing protein, partial [Clostridia bacterium]
ESNSLLPSEVKADINALSDIKVAVSVTEGACLNSITNGAGTLIPGTDYKKEGNKVTISKYYLKYYFTKFAGENILLSFNFSDGTNKILTVYTGSSAHPEFTETTCDFNFKAPEDVKLSLKLNGNFITSIEADMEKLVQRIDYTYSNDTKELIIRKGYLAGKFGKSMSPLLLSIRFTDGSQSTIEVEPVAEGYKAVAAGEHFTVALKQDGTVVAWGDNSCGQCDVPKGLTGVKQIAAGFLHVVALKEDGTVVAWGCNNESQCNVPEGLKGVKQIGAGYSHSIALKEDGKMVLWGSNYGGEGDTPYFIEYGVKADDYRPVKAIAAGTRKNAVFQQDDSVLIWGACDYGECGTFNGIKQVAFDPSFVVAVKQDGTVIAWGANGAAESVPKDLNGVKSIYAADGTIVALKENGTLVTWDMHKLSKYSALEGLKGVMAVAVSRTHVVALLEDGTLVAYGENKYGECNIPGDITGVK